MLDSIRRAGIFLVLMLILIALTWDAPAWFVFVVCFVAGYLINRFRVIDALIGFGDRLRARLL